MPPATPTRSRWSTGAAWRAVSPHARAPMPGGHSGNALRANGRLREAEAAMVTAQAYLEAGTGDPTIKARLCEQAASLYTFQRRFQSAIAALVEAAEIYRQLGETNAFARTLVQEATAYLYAG